MQDKSVLMNRNYVSVVIPWFNRPNYLDRVLDSIHDNIDVPFEIIVHDDGSTDGADKALIKNRDRISTLVLNSGKQLGLSNSLNRAISLATSDFIIQLNADCILTNNCLSDLAKVLSHEFVGFVGLETHPFDKKETHIDFEGTKFRLHPGVGSGCAFAFRKSFWAKVGGFDSNIHSGCADSPLQYKAWHAGFFRAVLLTTVIMRNLSNEINVVDGQIGKTGFDCSYPRLFGVSEDTYKLACLERKAWCTDEYWREMQKIEGGWGDLEYWSKYSQSLIGKGGCNSHDIDWEAAKKHGQDKWKSQIEGCTINGTK